MAYLKSYSLCVLIKKHYIFSNIFVCSLDSIESIGTFLFTLIDNSKIVPFPESSFSSLGKSDLLLMYFLFPWQPSSKGFNYNIKNKLKKFLKSFFFSINKYVHGKKILNCWIRHNSHNGISTRAHNEHTSTNKWYAFIQMITSR